MSTISSTVRMEGAEQVTAALDRLRSYRLMGEKQLRKIIQSHVGKIRRQVSAAAKAHMQNGDPRKASQAVKAMVYKSMIGFNVNLFPRKNGGAGGGGSVMVQTGGSLSGAGGNRRRRSPRTNTVDSYQGADRGFILRWMETGTRERHIKYTSDNRRKATKWTSRPNSGNRGKIVAKPFFSQAAGQAIQSEASAIRDDIMTLIGEVWEQSIKG